MSETYCGLLNVLILSLLAGAQGLVLVRQAKVKDSLERRQSGSDEDN